MLSNNISYVTKICKNALTHNISYTIHANILLCEEGTEFKSRFLILSESVYYLRYVLLSASVSAYIRSDLTE